MPRRALLILIAAVIAAIPAAAETRVVIGNGRLTAAIAPDGAIVSLTWPRPGLYEQLAPGGVALAEGHAADAIERIGPGAVRISGSRLPQGEDWAVVVSIPEDADALLIETESGAPPQWTAELSPMAAGVPGLPGAKRIFPGLGGFASMDHSGARFVFRTAELSSRETLRANELAANPGATLTQWNRLGEGAWLAIDGAGQAGDPAEILPLDGPAIRIAFGPGANAAFDALNSARNRTAANAPNADLADLRLPDVPHATLARQALFTLLALQDAESGAVPRRPWSLGLDAHDWPRDGYWTIAALRKAGAADRAQRQLAFYARAVESDANPDAPYGSLPAALQSDGAPALPPYLRDLEGPARFVQAAGDAGPAPGDEVAEAAQRALAFLTDWAHPVTRMPLAGFDASRRRDRASADQLPPLAAGLSAGIGLFTQRAPGAERWIRRLTEADALAAERCVTPDGAPALENIEAFLDTPTAANAKVGQAFLDSMNNGGGWAAVYGAALYLPKDEANAALREWIIQSGSERDALLGDSRAAAWAYLALLALEP